MTKILLHTTAVALCLLGTTTTDDNTVNAFSSSSLPTSAFGGRRRLPRLLQSSSISDTADAVSGTASHETADHDSSGGRDDAAGKERVEDDLNQYTKYTESLLSGDALGTTSTTATLSLTSTSSSSSKSSMEQFVADTKQVYMDLEHGGGSVKRRANSARGGGTTSAIAFTYIAPPSETTSTTDDDSNEFRGAWREQTPSMVDANDVEFWSEHYGSMIDAADDKAPPPLMVYLPGLDGMGISATAQFDDLSSTFEFWRMTIDKGDTATSFVNLVDAAVEFVEEAARSYPAAAIKRDVVLVGESFGGLLAPAVAMKLNNRIGRMESPNVNLKGVVLVNPATSFEETTWADVVPLLVSLRHLESGNDDQEVDDDSRRFPTPYSILGGVALSSTIPDTNQLARIVDTIARQVSPFSNKAGPTNDEILTSATDGFGILAEYLPPRTLQHRIDRWLTVGSKVVNDARRLAALDVPVLIVAGSEDNMLPSKNEADRLCRALPDAVKYDVAGSGHFVLDGRMNLTEVVLDSHIDPLDLRKGVVEEESKYDSIRDWRLPSEEVLKATIDGRVKPLRTLTSPVFFSTDAKTGKRYKGLSRVPSTEEATRPILIVSNHQFGGIDLGLIIAQMIEERGIAPRGLAHPVVFGDGGLAGGPKKDENDDEPEKKVRSQLRRDDAGSPVSTDSFETFGAVKVTPRNFYRLLQTNQTALLFPGGVREVFHGKDEGNTLFWPEKTDFVRIAAKFNATILPLSCIGASDSVNILVDAPDLLKLPFGIGDRIANNSASTVSARFNDVDNSGELFQPPIVFPKPLPARHYFVFGKEMDTASLNPKDKDACQEFYEDVQVEMNRGFDDLLRARKSDPYAFDGPGRIAIELLTGKSPPTFSMDAMS